MGDLNDLAASVAALLKQRGDTLAVSESSCGGLISAALVSIPGASDYYVGGSVVYTRTAQQGLLHVPESAMEGQRASTEFYALLNARTSREVWEQRGRWPKRGPAVLPATGMATAPATPVFGVAGPVERSQTLETGSGGSGSQHVGFCADCPGPCWRMRSRQRRASRTVTLTPTPISREMGVLRQAQDERSVGGWVRPSPPAPLPPGEGEPNPTWVGRIAMWFDRLTMSSFAPRNDRWGGDFHPHPRIKYGAGLQPSPIKGEGRLHRDCHVVRQAHHERLRSSR